MTPPTTSARREEENPALPAGWRMSWARLSIIRNPETGRFRLWAIDDDGDHHGKRRLAAEQPATGFATAADAAHALAEADPAAEIARLRRMGGAIISDPPREIRSIGAAGDPRLPGAKANPGKLGRRLERVLEALSAAVRRERPALSGLRILIGRRDLVYALALPADPAWTRAPIEIQARTTDLINRTVAPMGLNERKLAEAIWRETGKEDGSRGPAPTLWSEPSLVACGAPETTIEQLAERQGGTTRWRRPQRSGTGDSRRDSRGAEPGPTTPEQQPGNDGGAPGTCLTGVEEGWDERSLYRVIVRQTLRSFHGRTHAERTAILKSRPQPTGTKWDAVTGGVMEHAALIHGYDPPGWIEEPHWFLETPENAMDGPGWDETTAQPGPWLRRGVNIDPLDLDGRTGDGRQWVAHALEHQ